MKKLLAVLLTLTMLVTLSAFGASAEQEVGGADGVTTFNPTTTPGQDLNVKVNDVTHKYAVDIVYGVQDLEIGGTITWNVKTLKYDVENHGLKDDNRKFKVSNRSDLPVYAYAEITRTDPLNGIEITADKDSPTNKLTVAKARAGYGDAGGQLTEGIINISLKSADWKAVAVYYAAKASNENAKTFKIATVTVTISKD